MTIVDRYLLKKILTGLFIAIISFFFLYIIIDLFTNLQDILKNKVAAIEVVEYYTLMLPSIFILVAPIAFLLTALYTIGKLNRSNEMISLRTQGLSPVAIASIFLVLGLLISSLNLYIDDKIVPMASVRLEKMNITEAKKDNHPDIIKNFHFYTKNGSVVFARKYNTKRQILTNVNIFMQDSKGIASKEILANEIMYKNDIWFARNATVYEIKDGTVNMEDAKRFSTLELDFADQPEDIIRRAKLKWTDLSLKDITKQIKNFKQWKATKIVRLLTVEFHRKIAQNFALFFLLMGALPFSMLIKQRRAGMSALAMTVVLCFTYYTLFSLCVALGKEEFFLPSIACWTTNIFFGVSGITGMFYVK